MTKYELFEKQSFTDEEIEELKTECYSAVMYCDVLSDFVRSFKYDAWDPEHKTQAIKALWYLLLQLKESYDWFQEHEFDRLLLDYVDELKHSKENGEDRYSIRFKCLEHSLDPRTFERLRRSFMNDELSTSKVKEEGLII